MTDILDFITAALPWLIMGTFAAIMAVKTQVDGDEDTETCAGELRWFRVLAPLPGICAVLMGLLDVLDGSLSVGSTWLILGAAFLVLGIGKRRETKSGTDVRRG